MGRFAREGGIAAALCALVMLARPLPALGLLSAALGATLVGFSAWLFVGVMTLARRDMDGVAPPIKNRK